MLESNNYTLTLHKRLPTATVKMEFGTKQIIF